MNNILEQNEILCPNCKEPIINNSNDENEINEFTKLTCQNCFLDFSFIFCIFCSKKIFMKIYTNAVEYNGLNGYNIKCPYKSCQNIFYFTSCPKCNKNQKIKQFIKEGNIITCLYCSIQYIQAHNPIIYSTDITYIEKPKFYSNFPNGLIVPYNKEIIFQKINCNYCLRPIVYRSVKGHRNQYLECQKVECPYEDCRKEFNRLICPFCTNEKYINDGYYQMGSIVKCMACKKSFGKIICPCCKGMNICDNQFKLGIIKCGFANCLKESNMINCIFCRKINIFDLNENINGKTIKCGYCKNTFNETLCPFCRKINPFPLGDFCFGKAYKCQYLTCMKIFQFLICPKCFGYSVLNENEEGQRMKCDKCDIIFINFGCPFCKLNIIIYNSSFKIGQMVKCPNENCTKIFSFINCSKCKKLIFSQENENLCGKSVKCPYQGCERFTINLICPICKVNIIYINETKSFELGEIIICKKCKNRYQFKINEEIYSKEITYLKEIEGKTIDFGIGEIDENYLAVQELFFGFNQKSNQRKTIYTSFISSDKDSNNYNIETNIQLYKECIICHNNIKESIFYPCGHRLVCYNCAVILFSVFKKCPKCKKDIICIIKKIYE